MKSSISGILNTPVNSFILVKRITDWSINVLTGILNSSSPPEIITKSLFSAYSKLPSLSLRIILIIG